MPETTFPWSPVTLERPPGLLWIGDEAHFLDEPEGQWVIVDDGVQGRQFRVGHVVARSDSELRWIGEYGGQFTIRPTIPEDAERWDFGPHIPLPTDIIGAILNGATAIPTISAAVDNAGDVHTMILETGLGLYARYARTWLLLTDITPIEQLDIVSVPYDDLEHYDMADDKGHSISIRDLNPLETVAASGVGPQRNAPAPVTAAAVPQVIVASYADLPDAIAFAATDEGQASRWYVGRRAKAFGWADPLPWEPES
jgi:hypothetical protein